MSTIETRVSKSIRGKWGAKSELMLTDTIQLSISTHAVHSGELITSASVGHLEGNFVSHMMYQDYSKTISRSNPARCTAKWVENQHTTALSHLEHVLAEVRLQYGIEAELKADMSTGGICA